MSWCATTWIRRRHGRRARCWCTGRSTARPGLTKVAQFGEPVGPGTLDGLHHRQRAAAAVPRGGDLPRGRREAMPAGAPYLADADAMARVDGGPEALLRLDERRRLLDQPPLGPMLLTADAQRAGLPDARRHRHRHPAGPRNRLRPRRRPFVGDPRARRRPAHLQPGARLSRRATPTWCYGDWTGGRITVSSSAADSTALPNVAPATGADRGHRRRLRRPAGCPTRCRRRSGSGCRSTSTTPSPTRPSPSRPSATAVGAQVRRIEIVHRQRHQHAALRRAGQAADRGAALRRDAVGADHRGRHRRRLVRRAVRHHRLRRHPVRRVRLRPPGRACATPSLVPGPPPDSRCRTMGSGLGAAGPVGLRRRSRRRALRGGDGAVARGAGQPEPDADRAGTDFGDPDGVGARRDRAQPGRPGQRSRAPPAPPATPTRSTCWAPRTPPPTATRAPRGPRRSGVVQHRTPPNLTLTLPAARPRWPRCGSPRARRRCPPIRRWWPIDLGDGPQVRR